MYTALCVLAEQQKSLHVFASRAQIAQVAGLETKGLKNISRATGALHQAGYVEIRSTRIEQESGRKVELIEYRLRSGPSPLLPLRLLQDRLGMERLPDRKQMALATVVGHESLAVAVWWALARFASTVGSLTVETDKRAIAQVLSIRSSTGERVGRALKTLERANWIRILQRSGRRGNRVVPWRIRLVLGAVTRAFAPVDAVAAQVERQAKRASSRRVNPAKIEFPTSSNFAHELPYGNENRRKTKTTTTRNQVRDASGVPHDRFAPKSQGKNRSTSTRLATPSNQPEQMRPRILDHAFEGLFLATTGRDRIVEHLEKIKVLLDDLTYRVGQIDALKDARHPDHPFYRRHRSRWDRYRACLADWMQEATDIRETLAFVVDLVYAPTTPDEDIRAMQQRRRALQRRLKARRANRRNRPIYRSGIQIINAAHDCQGNAERFLKRIGPDLQPVRGHTRPPAAGPTVHLPDHAPRYIGIHDNGWAWDSLQGMHAKVPPGSIDGRVRKIHWQAVQAGEVASEEVQLNRRLQELSAISVRAVEEIRDTLGVQLPIRRDASDYGLAGFLHADGGGITGYRPPLFLVAGIAAVDTFTPETNLQPHAAAHKVFRAARVEYDAVPALGVVLPGPDRRLLIIHDDHSLPRRAGVYADANGQQISFIERFEGFVRVAGHEYGWDRLPEAKTTKARDGRA